MTNNIERHLLFTIVRLTAIARKQGAISAVDILFYRLFR